MQTPNFILYCVVYAVARAGMFVWHPVFHVAGRGNIPDGRTVICANHSGMADPIWIILAMRQRKMLRIMAKESLMHLPVLKYLFRWIGIIGVRRGEGDVGAIKSAIRALKQEEKLLIFPEGTRVPAGRRMEAKTGAVMLAARTDSPILPVYLTRKRWLFSPLRAVIGEPYRVRYAGEKPTAEELRALTDELMEKIYALGE